MSKYKRGVQMINKKLITRINELAHKEREQGLSEEEEIEQEQLREEYLFAFRAQFKEQIKSITVVDEEGNDVTPEKLKQEKDVRAIDVAKRLLDNGLHPPTVYFPLNIKEALMIEPTESESKKDLDKYIQTLIKITDEKLDIIKNAPINAPTKRLNEVSATKNQIFTWKMI